MSTFYVVEYFDTSRGEWRGWAEYTTELAASAEADTLADTGLSVRVVTDAEDAS